jgi:hypothetical protein
MTLVDKEGQNKYRVGHLFSLKYFKPENINLKKCLFLCLLMMEKV